MNTPNGQGSYRMQVKSLQVLCLALCGGVLIFALVSAVLRYTGAMEMSPGIGEYAGMFPAIGIGAAAVLLMAAFTVFRKKVNTAKDSINTLGDKLNMYRTALITY